MRRDAASAAPMAVMLFAGSTLTAAVILSMFLGTTSNMQKDAVDAAASAEGFLPLLQVRGLAGHRDVQGGSVAELAVQLSPALGSDGFALRTLAVQVQAGGSSAAFTLQGPPSFRWAPLLDASPPLDPGDPQVRPGDLVELRLRVAEAGLALLPRTEGVVMLLPAEGRTERVPFVVPAIVTDAVLDFHAQPPPPQPRWTLHRLGEP